MLDCGEGFPMTASIRPSVEAFYRASAQRDVAAAVRLIDDSVDWILQGPVDVFAFFGQRSGKASVIEGYRAVASILNITGYEVEALLVDGDRAAAMIRMRSIVRATGKVMSVRTTQFSRWRGGKIVEMRAVCDSYDLVEQAIGHELDPHATAGDVVMVA
jgi:ketosteroid isomerase-like protein